MASIFNAQNVQNYQKKQICRALVPHHSKFPTQNLTFVKQIVLHGCIDSWLHGLMDSLNPCYLVSLLNDYFGL